MATRNAISARTVNHAGLERPVTVTKENADRTVRAVGLGGAHICYHRIEISIAIQVRERDTVRPRRSSRTLRRGKSEHANEQAKGNESFLYWGNS